MTREIPRSSNPSAAWAMSSPRKSIDDALAGQRACAKGVLDLSDAGDRGHEDPMIRPPYVFGIKASAPSLCAHCPKPHTRANGFVAYDLQKMQEILRDPFGVRG